MKKLSLVLALSLVISLFSSLTVTAAAEVKIDKQGGYVTISNVSNEINFIDEGFGDTIYVSNQPVIITINGTDPRASFDYLSDSELEGDFFLLGDNREQIAVKDNKITLSKEGYYSASVQFGSEYSYRNVAYFIVQIVGEKSGDIDKDTAQAQHVIPVNVVDEKSGFIMNFFSSDTSVKIQKVKGNHWETGNFDTNVLTLKKPNSKSNFNVPLFDIVTTDPDAHRVNVSLSSLFGGQLAYTDEEFKDGKVTLSMYNGSESHNSLDSLLETEIFNVYFEVFDKDGNFLYLFENIHFVYDGFKSYPIIDPTAEASKSVTANPTASKIIVNGNEVSFEAYKINNNNFFKLRDIASVVNDTEKQFEVNWDPAKNAISLLSDKAYTAVGGELKVSAKPTAQQAKPTASTLYIDGEEVSLVAYTINGNNYFKLRDIAKAFNFGVTWDGAANIIRVDTAIDYVDEN